LDDLDKSQVIYQIPLKCGMTYIGETGCFWQTRMTDYKGYIKGNNVKNSAILEHLLECSEVCGNGQPGVIWDSCDILG
jgi:hypothetical protein